MFFFNFWNISNLIIPYKTINYTLIKHTILYDFLIVYGANEIIVKIVAWKKLILVLFYFYFLK